MQYERSTLRCLAICVVLALGCCVRGQELAVDFRFAPPQWQTAICLPDDPHKTLVDRSGELLLHYGQGEREFGTRVSVSVAEDARWVRQELHSPRVPIVRTTREAPDLQVVEEAFALTDLPAADDLTASAVVTTTDATKGGSARNDVILVHVTNTSDRVKNVAPTLVVDTALAFEGQLANQKLVVREHETITSSQKLLDIKTVDDTRRLVRLEEFTIEPKQTATFFVLYSSGEPLIVEPTSVGQAVAYRDKAVAYWQKAPLPWNRVQVPDEQIQALIDASIRNIWQAREIKNGLPAFQVGPTCYRGLWIVDGAFLLEAATMLGAGDQARNGVKYTLTFQQQDGRFEILPGYHKENGIVIWTCLRHAQLTQDRQWLHSVWPTIEKAMNYIAVLRDQSLTNEETMDDGLMPPGFPDGGLGPRYCYEYTNTYWNLAGVRAAVQAAEWLGKDDQASQWRKMYGDFYATFLRAAARDMCKDDHGHAYLPTYMGEAGKKILPQRAQWSFCHAVYPGQIFEKEDPFVAGMLAMLRATEREGMVFGTGWDSAGLWNYFASFYGHAWLWQGEGRKAAETLYAFANHAAPILAWREEQSPKGETYKKVGDMPHNWASAESIRLAVHLIALDRGDQLHLFEGLPTEWTRPGMVTRLNGIATPFGPLTMALTVADDGKSAQFQVDSLADPSCNKVIVHLGGWASREENATIELSPRQANRRRIVIEQKTD